MWKVSEQAHGRAYMDDFFNVLGLVSSTLSGFILLSISIRDHRERTERQKAIANAYSGRGA